jgi:hypothetical protein
VKAVIVSGSRDWTDEEALHLAILEEDPDVIIHGDCPTGADAMVAEYAAVMLELGRPVAVVPLPAQWGRLGDAAGMARNREMLKVLLVLADHGWDVAVVAAPLPGGRGTQGMVRIAKKAGVRVSMVETFSEPKSPPRPPERGI